MHKLSEFRTLRSGREVAYCNVCLAEVGISLKKGVRGLMKRCENEQKSKAKASRQNERKRDRKASERDAKAQENHAHYLWRQIVFERAGRCCEICGKGPYPKGDFQLQAHHLVKRSQSGRMLLDPANGAALCAGHHQWADRDPFGCIAKIEPREPGLSLYLASERRIIKARPFEEDYERLKTVAAMYGIETEHIKQAA